MLASYILSALGMVTAQAATTSASNSYPLSVHNISRTPEGFHFENLAIRANGQILTTFVGPGPYIYQIDPLGILPPTLVHEISIVNGSAAGIAEGEPDIFYVVAGEYSVLNQSITHPDTYQIVKLDMRGVHVLPNGTLNRQPATDRVANLTDAQLPNGAGRSCCSLSKSPMNGYR